MIKFYKAIANKFIYTNKIQTICTVNNIIYCNKKWWNTLDDTTKLRYIKRELLHLKLK